MSGTGPSSCENSAHTSKAQHKTKKRKPGRVATQDAYSGTCKTQAQLVENYGFSPDEVEKYFTAYRLSVKNRKVDPELSKAILAGRKQATRKHSRPTQEELEAKGYSESNAKAYLHAFDKSLKNLDNNQGQTLSQLENMEEHVTEEARVEAARAEAARFEAANCQERPTVEQLKMDKKYSHEQATAFLAGYDRVATDHPERKLIAAKKLGMTDALNGVQKPESEQLKQAKGFNESEGLRYFEGFKEGADSLLKKVKKTAKPKPIVESDKNSERCKVIKAAKAAAKRRWERPSIEWLKTKYSDEEVVVYLKTFDENKMKEEDLKLAHAKHAGKQAAWMGREKASVKELMENSYSESEAKAYLSAYESVELPDEATVKQRKAHHSGYSVAYSGGAKPTREELKLKNKYSEGEITAYLKGFENCRTKKVDTSESANQEKRKQATEQTTADATFSALSVLAMVAAPSPKNTTVDEQSQTFLPAFSLKKKSKRTTPNDMISPSFERKEHPEPSKTSAQDNSTNSCSSQLQLA